MRTVLYLSSLLAQIICTVCDVHFLLHETTSTYLRQNYIHTNFLSCKHVFGKIAQIVNHSKCWSWEGNAYTVIIKKSENVGEKQVTVKKMSILTQMKFSGAFHSQYVTMQQDSR